METSNKFKAAAHKRGVRLPVGHSSATGHLVKEMAGLTDEEYNALPDDCTFASSNRPEWGTPFIFQTGHGF